MNLWIFYNYKDTHSQTYYSHFSHTYVLLREIITYTLHFNLAICPYRTEFVPE